LDSFEFLVEAGGVLSDSQSHTFTTTTTTGGGWGEFHLEAMALAQIAVELGSPGEELYFDSRVLAGAYVRMTATFEEDLGAMSRSQVVPEPSSATALAALLACFAKRIRPKNDTEQA
jgi:hypothetical protein